MSRRRTRRTEGTDEEPQPTRWGRMATSELPVTPSAAELMAPAPRGPSRVVTFIRGIFRLIGRGLRALVFPVLAAAVVSVVLLIGMFPARSYLEQKDEIAAAQARLTQLSADNKKAEEELARLNTDPEIEKVAREQYGLVKPGEEVYHVMPAPQDPIAVPDVWPFDGMRKRMKAQPPAAIDPAAATGSTPTTAPASAPPTPPSPSTTVAATPR